MTNSEITLEAIRAARDRRAHAPLGAVLAEYSRPDDEPGVLWRGTLATMDGTEFEATIEAAPGPVVFRQPMREPVDVESIHPDYWRRAIADAV